MKLMDIRFAISGDVLTEQADLDRDISKAIACDVLSWAIANAQNGCAFVTIQTSMNTLAVASLMDMGCIIITHDAPVEDGVIKKANEEDIPIIRTGLSTFDVCGILYKQGVKGVGA